MVDGCNAEFARSGQAQRITIEQEVADGRTWTTMKFDQPSLTIAWTYDRGYLVAASDRGGAMRAIATRNGGSPLIWSPAFQQQMPGSIGLHPSGFFWLNTKGALQGFAALVQDPTIKKLIAERDPILVAFSASMEQIRTVSRTRFFCSCNWARGRQDLNRISLKKSGKSPCLRQWSSWTILK
jgi:hypothetical protein